MKLAAMRKPLVTDVLRQVIELLLPPEPPPEVPVRLTRAARSALVGASPVRVNQALGFFRKRGAISVRTGA